jgi:SAM-dependent methyltransferase
MTWRDFFDSDHSIYVSARHKLLHAQLVASGVASYIRKPDARVLDFGCGEALGARTVAANCGTLYLYEAAPTIRAKLKAAFVAEERIVVLDNDGFDALPDGSLDLIVVVSVLQYVGDAERARLFGQFHVKLADDGVLVLGDIVPKDLSPVEDAKALLEFGWRGGFLFAALAGLVRTAISDYRTLREKYGLTTYDDAEMRAVLAEYDFTCERARENIGHNQKRMTFLARKKPEPRFVEDQF